MIVGCVAQLGERLPCKQGVTGSSPVQSTKFEQGRSGQGFGPAQSGMGSEWLTRPCSFGSVAQ